VTFSEFFRDVWGHDPFPWQERLAALALAGRWPVSIGLPTAAGKTALIDIAVYALATGAPNAARRIFFVVDRRVIVDEAALRAEKLATRLAQAPLASPLGLIANALRHVGDGADSPPLATSVLRGCLPRDDSWTASPRQASVICSTVDQVGSSLLFRSYGTSEHARPIRAALAANDSLVIVDEAHNSQPFMETLSWIKRYRSWAEQPWDGQPIGGPFTVVEMSATPRGGEVFREDESDLANEVLSRRWRASKRARLVPADSGDGDAPPAEDFAAVARALVKEAKTMRDQRGAKVIGVIANRVRTAREVFEELKKDQPERTILLTGRARAYDRDEIWLKWSPLIALDRAGEPAEPIFVVATQCIEVGANIDFDALVTEVASLGALEQRFGRLNRKGRDGISNAAIVAQKDQVGAKYEDYVYGKALAASWNWLKGHVSQEVRTEIVPAEGRKKAKPKKIKDEFVEMGVLIFRRALECTSDRALFSGPRPSAPVLLPAHADILCQTSPEPALSPDPSVFLHGPHTEPAEVQVVWRQDLDLENPVEWIGMTAICPPSSAEAVPLPVWAVQQWIREQQPSALADIEGEGLPEKESLGRGESRLALWWRGRESQPPISAEEVRPGMLLVVPCAYGGCDEWGWNPQDTSNVRDVGDAVKWKMGRPTLRLAGKLAEQWNYSALQSRLISVENAAEARGALREWKPPAAIPWHWIAKSVDAIALAPRLIEHPNENRDDWAALAGRGTAKTESSWSYDVKEPLLAEHLEGAKRWAEAFAADLPARLKATVIRAAAMHDIGKADTRFQAWLRGGNPIKPDELIAKSRKSAQNAAAIERARIWAGYPKGGRHELMSVALLNGSSETDNVDFDLLLHLVGSHHGRCRPFAPVVEDPDAAVVHYLGRSASSDHRLDRLASGVSERFWSLTRKYGWYGLAYLEALVRLADHRQSEAEQKDMPAGAEYA
jgi:CRISPR-associated endonuclease/helicase Cas3